VIHGNGRRRRLGFVAVVAALLLTACARSGSGMAASESSPADPVGARYLAIAESANRRLETALDALDDRDRASLTGALADLRSVVDTERAFDRNLLALALPDEAAQTARNLVAVNEPRASLTTQAVGCPSLDCVRDLRPRLRAADALIETQVTILRAQLGLPPPKAS
jgi:hypothetical protein